MKKTCIVLVLLFFSTLTATGAAAQEGAVVNLESEVLKEVQVVNEKGETETKLVPVSNAMPGDVLVFKIIYSNDGEGEAEEIVLTNPVPEHMVYVAGSAEGEGTAITFSVDGGVTYGTPDSLVITEEDGREHRAGASDYTHIRWQLDRTIPQGVKGSVGFKARVK